MDSVIRLTLDGEPLLLSTESPRGHRHSVEEVQQIINDYCESHGRTPTDSMNPFEFLRDSLRPGMTAVDVGANRGELALSMCDYVGPTGSVYAIEPCAQTVETAKAHELERRATRQIQWLQMALGDHDGEVTLYHSADSPQHSLYRPNVITAAGEERVHMRTLNSLQASGELPRHVDLVKIDAQGAEDAIFKGASSLLMAGLTTWIVEIWPAGLYGAGTSVKRLAERLASMYLVPVGQSWRDVEAIASHAEGHASFDIAVCPS